MSEIIVTTRAELCDIIAQELAKCLARHKPTGENKVDTLFSMDSAVEYLGELGYSITKNTLYSLVSREAIPYSKMGRKTIFSRKELYNWVEGRIMRHTPSREQQAAILSQKASRKASA